MTRGEATKVRHKFGWTLEQMGEARYRELLEVKRTVDLTDLRVLTLPDGGLKELDPWMIEQVIRDEILRIEPHVLVTFPVHGISGLHDHIVTHFAVTRVYLELRCPDLPKRAKQILPASQGLGSRTTGHQGRALGWLQRLAFFTVVSAPAEFPWHVNVTAPAEIDCSFHVTDADMERFHKALDCYVTYAEVIARTKIHDVFDADVHFELFREDHKPPLKDLCEALETG